MLRCMGQAGPDGSSLAMEALDWLLELALERGTDLAWTGRPVTMNSTRQRPLLRHGRGPGPGLRLADRTRGWADVRERPGQRPRHPGYRGRRDPGYAIAWPDHPPAIAGGHLPPAKPGRAE
jgi:hypothetical protein